LGRMHALHLTGRAGSKGDHAAQPTMRFMPVNPSGCRQIKHTAGIVQY
jgi:hypothetical protein